LKATPKAFLENPRTALGLLFGYFLVHVILRSLISDSLQTDEAEQCLVTQVWLWGYGSQPPLYTWLQIPLFAVFGVNVFALSILKNSLLFSIYLFTYLTGREILRQTKYALLATFSLLLIVQFAWESQRDQTHLVLATAVAAATFYVAIRLFKTRKPVWYCLLGVLAALGVMAKYNYAVMIVSLLLAARTLPTLRPAVLDRRFLLTLACFLLVVAPHAYWALTNPQLLLSQSNKFAIPESDILLASLKGVGLTLRRIVEYAAGPLVVFSLLSFRAPKIAEASSDRSLVTLLQRMMLIGLGLCLAVVLAFHVTAIRARWFQPLLISLPLVAVAWIQPRLDQKRINALFAITMFLMFLVPATMYGRIVAAVWFGHTTNLNFPYRKIAAQIRSAGFTRGLILTEGHNLAGNFRIQFPESTIIAIDNIQVPLPSTNHVSTLVVWRSTGNPEVPEPLRSFLVREFDVDPSRIQPQEASAPALFAPDRTETLRFALVTSRSERTPLPFSQRSAMQ